MTETPRASVSGIGWLLPALASIAGAGVIYAVTQISQVPQANKAISDITSSMDHLRSDIQASTANTNSRIEALALQVGRSDISSQAVQAQLNELRTRQDRTDLADRELDVRIAKTSVELEGGVRASRLQGEAAERELTARLSGLSSTLDANAARSKEVDDRLINTVRALSERVDNLARGQYRGSYEPEQPNSGGVQKPSFDRLSQPSTEYRDALWSCGLSTPTLAVLRSCP